MLLFLPKKLLLGPGFLYSFQSELTRIIFKNIFPISPPAAAESTDCAHHFASADESAESRVWKHYYTISDTKTSAMTNSTTSLNKRTNVAFTIGFYALNRDAEFVPRGW
jgi:hypothetical protein